MNTFILNTGPLIQGKFILKEINIAFVFQVNCHGCFIYGFPTMNNLYRQFKNELGFIGISTAFEDFEFNSLANTQLLLERGITVGETKKYLVNSGISSYTHLPEFPVAFDKMSTPNDFLTKEQLTVLTDRLTQSKLLSKSEHEALSLRIKQHYIEQPAIAETFVLNQLRGTPSIIIFKKNFEILHSSFGHQNEEMLHQILQSNLI